MPSTCSVDVTAQHQIVAFRFAGQTSVLHCHLAHAPDVVTACRRHRATARSNDGPTCSEYAQAVFGTPNRSPAEHMHVLMHIQTVCLPPPAPGAEFAQRVGRRVGRRIGRRVRAQTGWVTHGLRFWRRGAGCPHRAAGTPPEVTPRQPARPGRGGVQMGMSHI